MTFRLIIGGIGILLILLTILLIPSPSEGKGTPIQEDSPLWNWTTMGNHTRGIISIGGGQMITDPLGFLLLEHHHLIDWTRTDHLRGDYTLLIILKDLEDR